MKHHRGWGFRGALVAAAAGTIALSSAAQAQAAGASEAPGAALRRQLSELAANPQSVMELVETGRAALAVGDGEAALGFFTRAEQLAPRDARVKAGLAAAYAHTGRPDTALQHFSGAVSLGAPEREIAGDRGLAYDLLGQTARAQQDYLASLRHREDSEVRRRLALSLAISGQPDAALRLLEDQVRQGDRAGNRARVLVLALSGDVRGATATANQTLPAQAAQALTPFFPRLAALSPGQKASAANLGRVPSGGVTRMASASTSAAPDPGALAFAGGSSTASSAFRTRLPVSASTSEARRRPGASDSPVRSASAAPVQARIQAASRAPTNLATDSSTAASSGASAALLRQPHPHQPLQLVSAAATAAAAPSQERDDPVELAGIRDGQPRVPAATVPEPSADPVTSSPAPAQEAAAAPVQLAAAQPAAPEPAAAVEQVDPAPADAATANLAVWNAAAPAAAETAASRPGFSDVVASVSSLREEPAPAASPPARRRPAQTPVRIAARSDSATAARPANTRAAVGSTARGSAAVPRTARTPQQTHPSRIWVQLGVAPSRSGFDYEIGRMRRTAPDLFRNRTAYVAPIGNSSRLLVGPFTSAAAARDFVNDLKQKDIAALSWTSPAGTEVERLAARR